MTKHLILLSVPAGPCSTEISRSRWHLRRHAAVSFQEIHLVPTPWTSRQQPAHSSLHLLWCLCPAHSQDNPWAPGLGRAVPRSKQFDGLQVHIKRCHGALIQNLILIEFQYIPIWEPTGTHGNPWEPMGTQSSNQILPTKLRRSPRPVTHCAWRQDDSTACPQSSLPGRSHWSTPTWPNADDAAIRVNTDH